MAEFGIVANVGRTGRGSTVEDRLRSGRHSHSGGRTWLHDDSRPAVAASEGAVTGSRPAHNRLASIERNLEATRCASRRRPSPRDRLGCNRCRSQGLSIGARLLGLDRTRPKQNSSGRQSEARRHQPTRRSLFAFALLYGRACRHPLREDPRDHASAMARELARPATSKGRCNRARQQARRTARPRRPKANVIENRLPLRAISPDQSDKVRRQRPQRTVGNGRTARHAEPVDPVIRTPKRPHAFSNARR